MRHAFVNLDNRDTAYREQMIQVASRCIRVRHIISYLSVRLYRAVIHHRWILLAEQSIHRTRKQKVLYGNYGTTNYSAHGDVSALTMNASRQIFA